MEIRKIHNELMSILKEIVEAKLPEDSDIIIKYHVINAIKELHRCILEEIEEKETLDQL